MRRPVPALAALAACAAAIGADAQLVDIATAEFTNAARTGGGVAVTLDLPTARTNWTENRWAVTRFAAPVAIAGDALKIAVKTARVRSDVGVYLAVMEADGSWYCHPHAVDLVQAEATGIARLRDFSPCEWTSPETPSGKFFDEDDRLDPGSIGAIAVGTINPLGVGQVAFTLTGLWSTTVGVPAPAPRVEIAVSGRGLDVAGTDAVPAGVFGGFFSSPPMDRHAAYRLAMNRGINSFPAATATTHMIIRTVGDRGEASPRLGDPAWEKKMADRGAAVAAGAPSDGPVYLEFWNEPYLNWANKNRKNFKPSFFDESKAAEGGPVHLAIDGTEMPHLRWTRRQDAPPWMWLKPEDWRRGKDAAGKVYSDHAEPPPWGRKQSPWNPATHPPATVQDGETYTVKLGKPGQEKEVVLTAFTPWYVYDATQHTYWSGMGMLKPYIDTARACGAAFKQAAKDRGVFIVGWGNRASEDRWAAFAKLYQPTIDALIDLADAVDDHDYGGDPTKMAANYEVLSAYALTKHRKRLTFINTECGNSTDPQAYAAAAGIASADSAKARWTGTKILHALDYVPDKVRGFAHFGDKGTSFFSDGGEGVVLTQLKNLRGRLLHVANTDGDLYVCAAVDGTDPRNPRPADLGPGPELVVAACNATDIARTAALRIAAPAGASFAGQAALRVLGYKDGKPEVTTSTAAAAGDAWSGEVAIPPRGFATVSIPLSAAPAFAGSVRRTQHPAPAILAEVVPQAPVATRIAVDPAALAAPPARAWIQYVVERLGEGEGRVSINGTAIPLPACVTPENSPLIRRLAIDPALVKADNAIEIAAIDPAQAGFLLGSISIVLESR